MVVFAGYWAACLVLDRRAKISGCISHIISGCHDDAWLRTASYDTELPLVTVQLRAVGTAMCQESGPDLGAEAR